MADLSSTSPSASEIMKSEVNKAIIAPQLNTPHSVGLHVPLKLTRENFLLWKTQLFPLLNCHGLAHVLTQDPPPPPPPPPPPISSHLDDRGEIVVSTAYQTWWLQDQQVLSLIVSSLSEAILPCVIGKLTAKEAWSALIKHCSSTNPSRIMHLHNRLHNTRSVADFVQEILRTCDELAAAGQPVQETVSLCHPSWSRLIVFGILCRHLIKSHSPKSRRCYCTGQFL